VATQDIVTDLAQQLALAFLRLGAALETPEGKSDLLRELGWDFPTAPAELDTLVAPVAAITAFADLEELTDEQIPELLAAAAGAFAAIANTSLPGDVNGEFPAQLADFIVVRYFFDQQPVWGFLLLLLGIVSVEQISTPPSGRLPYVAYSFAYAQIPNLLSDPLPFLKTQYGWGNSDFKGDLLLGGMEGFLDAWQLRVHRGALGGPFLAQLQQGALSPSTAGASPLWLVLVESTPDPSALNMGMGLYLLPETASARPGFALLPVASAGFNQELDLGENLTLSL